MNRMRLLFLQNWLDETFVKAAGWTLIHSLWQGLLLSLVAGGMILLTKRSRPAFRYGLLLAIFVVFVLAAIVTFALQLSGGSAVVLPDAVPETAVVWTAQPAQFIQGNTVSFWSWEGFAGFFNSCIPSLMIIWFVVFVFKCIRLTISLNRLNGLRRYNQAVSVEWERRLKQLAEAVCPGAAVTLRESSRINVPVAIGLLKPMILFPIGLLASLPPDQVEAILLHELAHIRRKDYFVNLLQCLVDSVFFFNPSLLWLSLRLREERENCCDDIAVSLSKDKYPLIHALISFQEGAAKMPAYVQPFPGKRRAMLHRIKRIIYNKNENLDKMEKTFLATSVAVAVAFAFGVSYPTAEPGKQGFDGINQMIPQQMRDTVPPKSMSATISTEAGGKSYKLKVENDVLTELYVDGIKIPNERLGEYKEITDKIIDESKAHRQQAEEERKNAGKRKADAIEQREKVAEEAKQRQKEERQAKREAERARRESREIKKTMKEDQVRQLREERRRLEEATEVNRRKLLESGETTKREYPKFEKDLTVQSRKNTISTERRKLEYRYKEPRQERTVKLEKADFVKNQKRESVQRVLESKKRAAETKRKVEAARRKTAVSRERTTSTHNLLGDLEKENLITDKNNVSVELSNDALIINGVKQPSAVHEKIKARYFKDGEKKTYRVETRIQ